ncbi:HlyD family type I secretion periplasmic adaptor subunit [Polycyclovorans algicola]|uniref:HlyD family type I secretion periplasmic adaptor subunit n=1 Tax=Polycyclovorans algicola TaxID=616992 RepID=UPI0004A77976|nr:HlyD family type I secretion periplasmic adaptor subunit [Polycyclovorans algicola]
MHTIESKSAPVESDQRPSFKKSSRLGWLFVIVGFFGFLLWAFLAPLDEGVPASGVVIVDGQRKEVQHPSGGIIGEILVEEGEVVEAGRLLLKMDATAIRSAYDAALTQWVSAEALKARLTAEMTAADGVAYPASLTALANVSTIEAMRIQTALFKSRREVTRAELQALQEQIEGLEVQAQASRRSVAARERELSVAASQLQSVRPLVASGDLARSRMLDLERSVAQIETAIAQEAGQLGRLLSQIAEGKTLLARRRDELMRELQDQFAEVQQDAEINRNRLVASEFELSHAEIRAPVGGTVVDLTVNTVGGVIRPGDALMQIVPEGEPLEVEAQIEVHLIDQVKVGLPVDLVFSALNQNRTPVVQGEVVRVSADRLTDERTGNPYYKALVRTTEEGAKQLAGEQIKPGMPVNVFVKTGERSMMTYLFKPLSDRARTALTER